MNKPIEFYIAIAAASLYVYESHKPQSRTSRFIITMSSAGLGFSIGPEAAKWSGAPLAFCGLLVTALGLLALEVASALVADRAFIKELIKRRLGG